MWIEIAQLARFAHLAELAPFLLASSIFAIYALFSSILTSHGDADFYSIPRNDGVDERSPKSQ